MYVSNGGVASGTVISQGGKEYVNSNGIDIGMVISSGGLAFISSGGTMSGGTLISGASLLVYSGGTVKAGPDDLRRHRHNLRCGRRWSRTITFAGSGGDLAIDNLANFHATIGGYSTGDEFDLGGFSYSSSETRSFTEAGSLTSGTLTVTDGAQVAHLTLLGSYVTSNFALSNDTHGGTFVKFSLTCCDRIRNPSRRRVPYRWLHPPRKRRVRLRPSAADLFRAAAEANISRHRPICPPSSVRTACASTTILAPAWRCRTVEGHGASGSRISIPAMSGTRNHDAERPCRQRQALLSACPDRGVLRRARGADARLRLPRQGGAGPAAGSADAQATASAGSPMRRSFSAPAAAASVWRLRNG